GCALRCRAGADRCRPRAPCRHFPHTGAGMKSRLVSLSLATAVLTACAAGGGPVTTATPASAGDSAAAAAGPFASTYARRPNPAVLIRNATLMTAAGPEIEGASILFRDGR